MIPLSERRLSSTLSFLPQPAGKDDEMNAWWGVAAASGFAAGALFWCRASRPRRGPEWVIFTFVFLAAQIVAAGFALSFFNRLASGLWWAAWGCALAALAAGVSLSRRTPGRSRSPHPFGRGWWRALPAGERRVLRIILAAAAATGLLNAGVVLFSAPHTWDTLAYRLPRVVYYLQRGNLGYFDANIVNQVAVQTGSSVLALFALSASGGNENLTQLWQFLAYWTAAACVFGISREIGLKRSAALLAAGIFALLTVCLMQSTTDQSDMLLAACAGGAAYSLIAYRRRPRGPLLLVSALGIGLGLGIKASFALFLPSLLLIVAYVFLRRGRPFGVRGLGRLALLTLAAVLILAIPAGYWANYRIFNHPLGPEIWRTVNAYEERPPSFILRSAGKTLLRDTFDFLSLDGMPALPLVWKLQNTLRYPLWALSSAARIDLEQGLFEPWFYFPPPHSHEDYSSWGIFGWALVWPALILAAVRLGRRRGPGVLAWAALAFIAVHALCGVYDFGGRARYFLPATVLALPAAGWWFYARGRALKVWLAAAAVLGSLSALTAVLFRYRGAVWFDQSVWLRGRLTAAQEETWALPGRTESVFRMDRLSQVLRDSPVFDKAIRNFERLVPPTATVAAAINPYSMEYLLFGPRLTRKIIPLNSFHRALQPVPPEADYLLWADDFDEIYNRGAGDTHLGKDWWLRNLRAAAKDDASGLFRAAETSSPEELKSLLAGGAEVDARNRNGWTPLLIAAARGNLPAVDVLLAAGADPSAASRTEGYSGFTALMAAAYHGQDGVVAALAAAGADVNAVDNHYHNETALMLAVKSGRAKSVRALIAAGADVNATNRYGVTALMYAASYGRREMVEALLKAGALAELRDEAGLTAARWSVLAGPRRAEVRRLLER
jgi:hypothetical protein